MTALPLAVAIAAIDACCFGTAAVLQHAAVGAQSPHTPSGRIAIPELLRSTRWWLGTGLVALGSGLQVVALYLAPLVVVQPVGVLSVACTVLLSGSLNSGHRRGQTLLALGLTTIGAAGFVVLTTMSTSGATSTPRVGLSNLVVLGAVLLGLTGLRARGGARCPILAASAAMLFGLAAVLIRGISLDLQTGGLSFSVTVVGAEVVLLAIGGTWLLQHAYAAGPAAIVLATVTLVDPLTAVTVALGIYHETMAVSAIALLAEIGFAVAAVVGVILLARALSEPRSTTDQHRQVPVAAQLQS